MLTYESRMFVLALTVSEIFMFQMFDLEKNRSVTEYSIRSAAIR